MELGICTALTILFVALKLIGVISWAWVWVLSPFWIGTIVTALFWVLTIAISYRIDKKVRKDMGL